MFTRLLLTGLIAFFAGALSAEEQTVQDIQPVMRVEGDRMIYDTFQLPDDLAEVSDNHVDPFLALLKQHDSLKVLALNSSGGSVWASKEIARFVEDYGLETEVTGECSSACVNIFLAGTSRRMQIGSKIGFHQTVWDAEYIEDYFDNEKADFGWETPFDLASWLYGDTQTEVYERQTYMLSRGVTAEFAIKTIRPTHSGVWFPTRAELQDAGVLRAAP